MAIGLVRYKDINDPDTIDLSENIASTRFYNLYWEPAIKELGIKLFQENGYFCKEQLDIVMNELNLLKDWANKELTGSDLEYMVSRIENLEKVIPNAFIDEDTTLYIY